MPILGDATTVTARLTKSASNALRIQLASSDGTELGRAQQKSGAAVLFSTHEPQFAARVADRTVALHDGRVSTG